MYNGDTKEFDLNDGHDDSVNEIIEIRNGEEIETLEDEIIGNMSSEEPMTETPKKKKKNIFKMIKNKWNALSKKGKIIVLSAAIILLVIVAILLAVALKKDDENNKPNEETVVLEADNYRYENGKLFFLDSSGEDIGSYECKNKDEKLCYVAYSSDEDKFDVSKNVYEDETPVLERMRIINDDYVFIYDNEKENEANILLYSINENSEHETYKLVKQYNKSSLDGDYVIAVTENGDYTLLSFGDSGYEDVLETEYDYLGIITENKTEVKNLVAKKNDKWYLIDFKNKEITKPISYEIKDYNDSYLSVLNENEEYLLYDYDNNQVTEDSYDYIDFSFEFVSLVKDKKINVYDSKLNKLHEEAFKLYENDNYTDINVFNKENGELVKTNSSFELVLPQESNSLSLYITKGEVQDEKIINTLESVVSANYETLSYFDGKLYIYSDVEKTNLLGSYECSNKNDITSADSKLDNCFIASNSEFSDNDMNYAKKSVGLLPIFNNRFIFIKDNPEVTSAETMNIVLYDLASSKKLGSYRAIDALGYNGRTGITFVEGTNILLMAKNTKDYYGVLKVNLSEVGSLANVKFNDKNKKVESMGEYYLIQKSTDTYYLIDANGEAKTSEYSGKIMGYKNNYVKVKTGNGYKVYSFDGDEIASKTANYVELYNTVYAAVDANNEINIYKYNDSTNKVLCNENIKLNVTSNYKEGKSFTVIENGSTYTIAVYNSDGTKATYTCPEVSSSEVLVGTE